MTIIFYLFPMINYNVHNDHQILMRKISNNIIAIIDQILNSNINQDHANELILLRHYMGLLD